MSKPKTKSPPKGTRAETGAEKPKRRATRRRPAASAPVPAAVGVAGFDFQGYNRQFLERAGEAAANDAAVYGARVEPIAVTAGQPFWKVIGIHHLTPDENRDRHNAYIEALDEAGNRVQDGALRVGWIWEGKSDGPAEPKRLDKPPGEPAADVPIEKNMTVTLWLEGDGASEQVAGLHTRHNDEHGPGGGKNSLFHHSYYVVFQRTRGADGGPGTGDGEITEGAGEVDGETPVTPAFRFEAWPTVSRHIIQPFGVNPEIYQPFELPGHEGVDIEAPEDSPIVCVAPGVVKMVYDAAAYAEQWHAYGIHVRVQHADGYETIYAHLKEPRVAVEQEVRAGDLLGLADHTGNVFGDPPDHLHLTLKRAGQSAPGFPRNIIDPMPFLAPLLTTTPDAGTGAGVPGAVHLRVTDKLGLNCNAPSDAATGAITPRVADPSLIADMGVGWVRINFIVRPFDGPTNPAWISTYRTIIQGLRSKGLKIYGLIGAESVHDDPSNQFRDAPQPGQPQNDWIKRYAENFREIVQLFRDDVTVYESFNEPNNWHRTPGDPVQWSQAWVHPAWFAIMLQRVYDAVRDLNITLVSGPLLSTPDGNDAAVYLPKVYKAGQERFGWGQPGTPVPFDGVGFHPYVLGDASQPDEEIPPRYQEYMDGVRAVIRAAEGGDRPIYLSEIGWQNAEDRQPACMATGLRCALDDPSVALVFWYGMQDDAAERYGLYRMDGLTPGHRKPVYDRFVEVAREPRTVPVAVGRARLPVNDARFGGEFDTVPDGAVLGPGRAFTKVWRMVNTGATTWADGYRLAWVEGQSLGAPATVETPYCPPGESADITVNFVAPATQGEYWSYWRLVDPEGNPFGERVWTQIQVAAVPVGAPAVGAFPPMAPLPAVPAPGQLAAAQLATAAALAIIYSTYWMRIATAASAPDPHQAMLAAANDALEQIKRLGVEDGKIPP
ncbi:MAG: peptidoglycan DD-metalloendopeptidase family protein [Caldilineaceae bacterium]|nr:peptidoglycan DD-metalloendopeptidase family protein [Caldilineaceae bacterium]